MTRPFGTSTDIPTIVRTGNFLAGTTNIAVRRLAAGSDSLVARLNDAPYDSTLASAGNIIFWLELVRVDNGSVVWRGDTLSARDVADSGRDDRVTIPINSLAIPGIQVFVRMKVRTTTGLPFDLSGGFQFIEDSVGTVVPKRSLLEYQERPSTGSDARSMVISIVPNPARSTAELSLTVVEPGEVRVSIHNMLGEVVREMPRLDANDPGLYTLHLDLEDLPAGTYLIVAQGDAQQSTSRFTVTR